MKKRALCSADWKLIEALEHPDLHGCPPLELYHLPSDPGEMQNLAETEPEVVRSLQQEMRAWIDRRVEETGLPDPLEAHPVTLRQIGRPPESPPVA